MTTPGKLEAAFGADRSADPLSWTWTDLTDRSQQNRIAITRERRGSGPIEAGQFTVPLDNGDGALSSRKATSTYYPNVKRGLAVRHSLNFGERHLALTGTSGSRLSTPDHADLDITGDLAGVVEFLSPIRVPPTGFNYEVVGKFNATGSQRSWLFFLSADGTLKLRWSTNGTAESDKTSSIPLFRPDSGPVTVAWEFDVNVGGTSNTLTWYAIRGETADLLADLAGNTLGDPDTDSGTTSIHSGTATLDIGDVQGSGFAAYPGMIRRFQLRSGDLSTGTIVTNPDLTIQTAGASSFNDTASTSKTWTVNSPAAITDRKVRMIGELGANEARFPGHGVEDTAQVEWQVNGPLRRLRQGEQPLQSALYRTVTATNNEDLVYAAWPCEDGRDSEFAYSPIDGVNPGVVRMTYATDDALDAAKALPQSSDTYGWAFPVPSTVPTTEWEVTWFVNIPTAETSPAWTVLNMLNTTGTIYRWRIRINDTNVEVATFDDEGTSIATTTFASDSRQFGTWMLITLYVEQSGSDVIWDIELIPIPLGLSFSISPTTISSQTCGRPTRIHTPTLSSAPPDGISAGWFIVTSGAVTGWLAPADTAYVGEPAPQRFHRLCQEEGITPLVDGPYGGISSTTWATALTAGAQSMGPQRPIEFSKLLQECAEVDEGLWGESRELLDALVFRAGVTLYNQSAALSVTNEVTGTLAPVDDDQDLVNDATVTRTEGGSARHIDQDSIDDLGRYEDSRTINCQSDARLPSYASWWVHEATAEEDRVPELPIELAKNDTLADDWHHVNFGDPITASGLPDVLASDSLTQLMDGYSETISTQSWTVKGTGRPSSPREVAVLGDASMGKLDTAGSQLSAGITDVATSLSVATTLGPLWDPADTEDGFDIGIGGEQMTVTDISGATSPQTFTVTRSVNGVVKSHSSGAAVSLWRPPVLAL